MLSEARHAIRPKRPLMPDARHSWGEKKSRLQTHVMWPAKTIAGDRRASHSRRKGLLTADARHEAGRKNCPQQTRVTHLEERIAGGRRSSRLWRKEITAGDARSCDCRKE